MTIIFTRAQIDAVLPRVDAVNAVARGFVAFSKGNVVVPPVGELLFPEANGELHIKYGAVRGDQNFVVKLATGFFKNPQIGLPPFGGCMIIVSQKTGLIESILLEEGELTNHRTAAAGALTAQVLAPKSVSTIGIVGTGTQARMQADYLRKVIDCENVMIWGRRDDAAKQVAEEIRQLGYHVTVTNSLDELCKHSRLIVTTTASDKPLITRDMVRPGTHITAMGSDTADKQELAPDVLKAADVVVADSLAQSEYRGEIYRARKAGIPIDEKLVELGAVIAGTATGRTHDQQITIADLTGVGVQDIMIAIEVLRELQLNHP